MGTLSENWRDNGNFLQCSSTAELRHLTPPILLEKLRITTPQIPSELIFLPGKKVANPVKKNLKVESQKNGDVYFSHLILGWGLYLNTDWG